MRALRLVLAGLVVAVVVGADGPAGAIDQPGAGSCEVPGSDQDGDGIPDSTDFYENVGQTECSGYGGVWYAPAGGTTTTTAAPATTTTTAAPATTTTTAAPATTTTTAPATTTTTTASTGGGSNFFTYTMGGTFSADPAACSDPMRRDTRYQFGGSVNQTFAKGPVTGDPAGSSAGCFRLSTVPDSGIHRVVPVSASGTATALYGPLCVRVTHSDGGGEYGFVNRQGVAGSYLGYSSFPNGIAYLFRPSYDGELSQGVCSTLDSQLLGVPTPALGCTSTVGTDGRVSIRGKVLNPRAGAEDSQTIRFPWETAARAGGEALNVPLPPLDTIPAGGWRVVCSMKRRVGATYTGSNAWKVGATFEAEPTDSGTWSSDPKPKANYTIPPVIGTLPPGFTVGLVGAEAAAAAGGPSAAAGTAAGLTLPTAGVVGAGVGLGYLLGGVATSAADWLGLDGDQEWACRYLLTYRATNGSLCDRLLNDRPQLRSVVRLGVCSVGAGAIGSPDCPAIRDLQGASVWTVAEVFSEVLIDPRLDPRIGRRTVTGLQLPVFKPADQPGPAPGTPPNEFDQPSPSAPNAPADSTTAIDTMIGPTNCVGSACPVVPNEGPDDGSGCWSINPLTWFKGLGCFVKWLLFPDGNRLKDEAGSLWASLSDKMPFTLFSVIQWPGNQLQAASDAAAARASIGAPADCFYFPKKLSDGSFATGVGGYPVLCAGGPLFSAAATLRLVVKWMLYIGLGFGLYNLGKRTLQH